MLKPAFRGNKRFMIEVGTREFRYATLALCLGSGLVLPICTWRNLFTPHDGAGITLCWIVKPVGALTITILMLSPSLLVYGPLSDAIGRKPIMVMTMAGAVLSALALSQVHDYRTLLILRGIQGFCLGGLPAIAIAYMGDESSRKA